jgi:hypothetical protein
MNSLINLRLTVLVMSVMLQVACQPINLPYEIQQTADSLQPPSPHEICAHTFETSTQDQRVTAITTTISRKGALDSFDSDTWNEIIVEAGDIAGIATNQPEITVVPNDDAVLAIVWWCTGTIHREVYVIDRPLAVSFMCLLIDSSAVSAEWSWSAEKAGNGWGLMNIFDVPHSDSYEYLPLVITRSSSGWSLIGGDGRGLLATGPSGIAFQRHATYSFADDFSLTFHFESSAPSADQTYLLQGDHYEPAETPEP